MTRTSAACRAASRRRLERGSISWVTLLLLTTLVVGSYLAVVWVPVYLVHHEVKRVVRNYVNLAVKDRNDEALVVDMCRKLRSLDEVQVVDQDGDLVKAPAVDVTPQDVTWERDTTTTPPTLHVAFEYVRVVRYPFLDRTEEKVLSVDYTDEIGIPQW